MWGELLCVSSSFCLFLPKFKPALWSCRSAAHTNECVCPHLKVSLLSVCFSGTMLTKERQQSQVCYPKLILGPSGTSGVPPTCMEILKSIGLWFLLPICRYSITYSILLLNTMLHWRQLWATTSSTSESRQSRFSSLKGRQTKSTLQLEAQDYFSRTCSLKYRKIPWVPCNLWETDDYYYNWRRPGAEQVNHSHLRALSLPECSVRCLRKSRRPC